jgi:hypothetical protein
MGKSPGRRVAGSPGRKVLTIEPPLVADMQLIEPVRIKVE